MKVFKSVLRQFNITDVIVILFYVFLTVMNIVFHEYIGPWKILITINIGILLFIYFVAYIDRKKIHIVWYYIHYWYLVPLVLLTFKELYQMIHPIRKEDYDYLLIAADRFIFGTDPTVVLKKIANPVLTEILQIAYGTFYFLPIILGIDLIRKKRFIELDYSVFAVIYGFLLSYLAYFFLPAIGPRFTLHDFQNIDHELPGLLLTKFLREVVNTGESIPSGTPNPAVIVQRDVFPSGHTEMTLIVLYLSVKFNVKSKFFLIPAGILLIFATVYLRYHYFIDLVGGFILAVITLWSGYYIYNNWQRFTENPEILFEKNQSFTEQQHAEKF